MRGRIRSVKPEFYQHGGLYDAEVAHRLPLRIAFEGLWSFSDREGRFEWKPRELKLNIIPYDPVDMAAVLDALATRGFIVRYRARGKDYGWIPSFLDHQQINNRESKSTLPPPPRETVAAVEAGTWAYDPETYSTRPPRVVVASSTRHGPAPAEGKGSDLNGAEITASDATHPASRVAAAAAEDAEDAEPIAEPTSRSSPLGQIAGAVRKVWWVPDGAPPDGWDMGRELSIWKPILEAGAAIDECIAVIHGASWLRAAGGVYGREEFEPIPWLLAQSKLTGRIFKNTHAGSVPIWTLALEAYGRGPATPAKPAAPRRTGGGPARVGTLVHGPPGR